MTSYLFLRDRSNLAFEAQHLLHHLQQMNVKGWISLAEGAHGDLGWLTTHSRKEGMALALREALRVGKIAYSPRFFTVSMSQEECKRRIGDELRNFSVITEPGKTHFSKVNTNVLGDCPHIKLDKHASSFRRSARRTLASWVGYRTTSRLVIVIPRLEPPSPLHCMASNYLNLTVIVILSIRSRSTCNYCKQNIL